MASTGTNGRRRVLGHCAGGAAMRRLPIGFDPDTFDDIERTAAAASISFAERVRQLVELGRETEHQEKDRSRAATLKQSSRRS